MSTKIQKIETEIRVFEELLKDPTAVSLGEYLKIQKWKEYQERRLVYLRRWVE